MKEQPLITALIRLGDEHNMQEVKYFSILIIFYINGKY